MKIPFVQDRGELLRWALSGAAVVLLHGAVAAAMVNWSDEQRVRADRRHGCRPRAVPDGAAGERDRLCRPDPAQVEAEASPQTPVTEVKEQIEERLETAQSRELQPELASAVNPEVVLDTTPPKPEQKVEIQQENQLPAPETTAPPEMPEFERAEVAAAQVQGAPTRRSLQCDPDVAQLDRRAAGTQQALPGRRAERSWHRARLLQRRPQRARAVEPHCHDLRLAGARP